MALSARELLLIVRAQNQASGALRRVARDVRGLPDMQALRMRRDQQGINIENLRRQRQIAQNELRSVETGRRRIANERRILSSKLAQQRADLAISRHDRQKFNESTRQLNQQRIMQNIAYDTARLEALRSRAIGKSVAQQAKYLERAATDPLSRAAIIENRLRNVRQAAGINRRITTGIGMGQDDFIKQARVLQGNVAGAKLGMQAAIAAETDLNARAGILNHTLAIQADRLALAERKWRIYNNAISSARWERVAAGGRVLQHFGRVAQYAGLIAGGAFAYMASSAAKFNTQSTLAATQVANRLGNGAQGVATASAQISGSLAKLLQNSEDSSQGIQAAAYDIFSSMTLQGSQREQINQGIAILGQFNKAAIGGQADIEAVTHAGITILNNFAQQGRQVQQLPQLLNRMFAGVRFGRITVQEFVGTLNQLAPAFSAAFGRSPQTFDQLTGALAALTRQMPSVRMASTGLARLTEMFGRRDFVAGLKTFGVNITDAEGRLIPLEQIITKLAQRFPKLQKGGQFLQNFFKTVTAAGSTSGSGGTMGTIQGRRALQLLILNLQQYRHVQGQVVNDNNEFTKSFQALRRTPEVQWRIFVNVLRSFAIQLGTQAIPAITQLARPLMQSVRWFNRLDESTKRQIGRWGVFTAAILLVASGVSFALGTFIRLFAFMARGLGILTNFTALFVGLYLAVGILTGHWDELNGLIDRFVNFGTGSIHGWVIMLGLGAVAALRMAKAIRAIGAAEATTSLLGGIGGMRRTGGTIRELYQVRRLEGAGRILSGIGAGMATFGLSAPLMIGGMAALGIGALIWKRRMDQAREALERLQAKQRSFRTFVTRAPRAAAMGDVTTAVTAQQQLGGRLGEQRNQLAILLRERQAAINRLNSPNVRIRADAQEDVNKLSRAIMALRGNIRDVENASAQATVKIRQMVRADLTRQFPRRRIAPGVIADLTAITNYLRRRLTRRESKLLLDFEVNPRAKTKIPAEIRAIINIAKRARKEQQAILSQVVMPRDMVGRRQIHGVGGSTATTASEALGLFKRADIPAIKSQFEAIGASIDSGIIQGLHKNSPMVNRAVKQIIDAAFKKAQQASESGSPSRRAAREIGEPYVQGIIMGIRNASPLLRQISQSLTVDLFPATNRKNVAISATAQITGQLRQLRQFNTGLARLENRGVPKRLLKQLGEGGLANVKLINELVRMSPGQLDKYVGVWRNAMGQIAGTVDDATKAAADKAKENLQTAVDNMSQIYTQFKDQNIAAFGDITSGVRTQNAMEFGGIPRASDLLPDLRDQVRNFDRWRRELGQARRRLPSGVVKQLQEAGPSAEPMLRGLLRMTPRQIRAYAALWRRGQRSINRATSIDFNNQLGEWRKHGRKAARLFMMGMRDENSWIGAQMRKIFLSFLKGKNANFTTGRGGQGGHTHNDNRIVIHHPKEDTRTTVRKAKAVQFKHKHKPRRTR